MCKKMIPFKGPKLHFSSQFYLLILSSFIAFIGTLHHKVCLLLVLNGDGDPLEQQIAPQVRWCDGA